MPNTDEAPGVLLIENLEPDVDLALHHPRRSTLPPTSRRARTGADLRGAARTFKLSWIGLLDRHTLDITPEAWGGANVALTRTNDTGIAHGQISFGRGESHGGR